MQQAKEQSLVSIDIARAIAALGVFYYHQHIGRLLADQLGPGFRWVQYYTEAFGSLYAVPLFFLISGYCIHLSNIRHVKADEPLPLKKYYIRRLRRLYPPYAVALLISFASFYFTRPGYHISFNNIWVHILLLQGFTLRYFFGFSAVLWTISIELALYLIYPIFYYLRRKFSLNAALLITFFISSISISYFSITGRYLLTEYYFVLNIWFAWCCGAYLADKIQLNPGDIDKPVYKIIYAAILVVCILFQTTGLRKIAIVGYQLNILAWSAPLVLLIKAESWLSHRRNPVIKITAMIGLSSYSLYLLHTPLIKLKSYCVSTFLPQKLQHAGVILGFFLIPVVTWFAYKYIEKPFMARKPEPIING